MRRAKIKNVNRDRHRFANWSIIRRKMPVMRGGNAL